MFKPLILAAAVAAASLTVQAGPATGVTLQALSAYDATADAGSFDSGAAEIVAHDPVGQRLYVINANDSRVDVLDMADPAALALDFSIDVAQDLDGAGGVNSVAVKNDLVAVAVENDDRQAKGWIAFYDTDGVFLNAVEAGALPDAVTFTHNGLYLLSANEGEPNDDYTDDPEGSITIVDLRRGVEAATAVSAGFGSYNDALPEGVRVTGPGATVARDLEPEFITTSRNSRTAWVTLQENNALAIVDIPSATVTDVVPLGVKDHSLPGFGLDASNRDDAINITNWPVYGMYMPDGIASYKTKGKTYLVTANEGDAREYAFDTEDEAFCLGHPRYEFDDDECIYIDEARAKDLTLDPAAFGGEDAIDDLLEDENLGRLKIVRTEGQGENGYQALYSYGGRSISIWDERGALVWDSGDSIEMQVAQTIPSEFNSNNDENDSFDARSDDKGPEPEGVVVGKVRGKHYAFVGLERVGGVMIFDVTDPANGQFMDYINNRDFGIEDEDDLEEDVESPFSTVGDLGPEGLVFIKAEDSPSGEPLLVVGNEISGTTTVYQVVSQ